MFGKKNRLNELQSRKQLLIAESDLNRALMLHEYHALADGLHDFTDRAKAFSAIGSSIIPFVAGLVRFARRKAAPPASKSSWFQKALRAARLAFAMWGVFRSQRSTSEESRRKTASANVP